MEDPRWMVGQIMHLYFSRSFTIVKELGVHPGQVPVLKLLFHQQGLSQKEIADHLCVKPPTVTVTIQRMEKLNLIYKKQDEHDQRVSRIFLTEQGKNVIKQLKQNNFHLENEAFHGFSPEELEEFNGFLIRIRENLKKTAGKDEFCAFAPKSQ